MAKKSDYLNKKQLVKHIDITRFKDLDKLVAAMGDTSFQARNLSRAADIFDMALREKDGMVFLCLAGSLVSAGLKKVITDLVENNMVDAIVSTGAIVVDQDFFEGLGFSHYKGTPFVNDAELRELAIDRIYDHYIDEDELRVCDEVMTNIFDGLEPRPYSSREVIFEMGRYLTKHGKKHDGFVEACYRKNVPIFVPAFSDCSAGFGIVLHQHRRIQQGKPMVSLDSGRDFLELTYLKMYGGKDSGIVMIGGGVPKNFVQDTVVSAEVLGMHDCPMHKYAVQLTVADERDGALSGSTLKEASSWGKVDLAFEQMVFGEATVTFPLLAGAVYARGAHKGRKGREFATWFDGPKFIKGGKGAKADKGGKSGKKVALAV
ncbi:MAG: deoxyhypusine synthase [Planctomycetes bacterium]|jgi:deoxyhypusine synthase|nr:deoxyhypusine synthase [Planctomycetota bacterium]MCL4731168.1 deoxyhypusine synthase [Planctomycetota bacterium]